MYIQFVSALLETKYHYDPKKAGAFISIPYTICMIISPGIGLLLDATGNRLSFATFGSFLCLLAHCLELVLPECYECDWALVPLFIQGFSYSIYVILNYSTFVAYLVEP